MYLITLILVLAFVMISEAEIVENNQSGYYGHSGALQSYPISYQSFVNYDKFEVDQSSKPGTRPTSLFMPADYAAQAAYTAEVESAQRFASANRHNNSDAAYIEAYNEALKAQRKAEAAETDSRYISHLFQHKYASSPDTSRLPVVSKSEDTAKEEYYVAANEDVGQSVEYIAVPDYKFSANGVVHHQPQRVAETAAAHFGAVRYDSKSVLNYA